MKLLKNQTANTDGSQATTECSGGNLLIQVAGIFDNAELTIQGSMEGFDFQDLKDENGDVLTITEPTIIASLFCKPGLTLRASLTGAGASTDVSVGVL